MVSEVRLAKVSEKVPVYTHQIGVNPGFVAVKSLKSRWGSSTIRRAVSLAWHIISAPERILDYLIVHELCHIVHHNHSAQYWNLVATILPDHRQSRKWLRENGRSPETLARTLPLGENRGNRVEIVRFRRTSPKR